MTRNCPRNLLNLGVSVLWLMTYYILYQAERL